jgi:RNA polymerase sigma factor (sigma-70 family)
VTPIQSADGLLARTLREESGLLVARLARQFHDFDLAEEAVQTAVSEALEAWRRDGAPDNPAAWLQTAARHNALDLVRRRSRQVALAMRLAPAPEPDGASYDVPDGSTDGGRTDDRLALLFACCHPALAPEARLALTLRAVVGMTTPQIARAFLVNERTLAQRIVRAKRKIVTAGIALTVPADDVLAERLSDVLAVVALMYNEGFVSSDGATQDRDLAGDAVWLAGVVATSLPGEAEAWGLAALLTFQHARAAARFSEDGDLVLLPDQDRSRWDHAAIAAGEAMLERAAALHAPGPFQLRAAIAACHATSPSWAETDWLQIVTLFEVLTRHDPSPVVRLNRAVAMSQIGPHEVAPSLAAVDELADHLDGYHLFHATRAELLTRLGRDDEAAAANARALSLTTNDAERRLLATRLHRHPLTDGS